MMKELFGFLKEMLNRLFSSRLFALSIVFFLLFFHTASFSSADIAWK